MKKILSLIIPTYNMERYLNYCLDSLLINKNFDALEVLVINDGSKDNSLSIARSYANRYPTVFRVIDKPNGNYGSCINHGLKEATGKYVKILDADDSFDTQNFEGFVSLLTRIDADLVLSDIVIVNEQREQTDTHVYDLPPHTLLTIEDVASLPTFQFMQMHAVTYRRENLLKLKYRQTEGISYTDLQWIFIPMIAVQNIYRYDKPIYRYLVGRPGQTMDPTVRNRQITQLIGSTEGALAMFNMHESAITSHHRTYLFAMMTPLVKNVYISLFTNYSKVSRQQLLDYDAHIHQLTPAFYDYIGSAEISSFMGFQYIKYWRDHPQANIQLIRCLSSLYLILLKAKQWIKAH